MNRWYDFADGKGGNLVDFGILLHRCSISDFLQKLDSPIIMLSKQRTIVRQSTHDKEDNAISVLSVHSISSYPLQKYLHTRRINQDIAGQYLKEVRYKNMYYNQPEPASNFLVLNSTSFFEKSLSKMQEHQRVHLYLDNDKTGQKCTQKALDLDSQKFKDERKLYKNYDDLNDWLMNIGQSHMRQIRQKP